VATNIAPIVRDLAGRLGLELVDLHTRLAGHSEWFPDNVHPNSKGMTVMAAVVWDTLAKQAMEEPAPSLDLERLSPSTRMALTWPASGRGLVPQSTTKLNGSNTVWSVVEPVIYLNGDVVQQTNTISGSIRVFRLWEP
jgi:hypothetical protein